VTVLETYDSNNARLTLFAHYHNYCFIISLSNNLLGLMWRLKPFIIKNNSPLLWWIWMEVHLWIAFAPLILTASVTSGQLQSLCSHHSFILWV